MAKSNGTIVQRLNLCGACRKPVGDNNFISVANKKTKHITNFHKTAIDCANAEPLKKDWYRQNDRTRTHNRAKARLQEGDGYSWESDDSMPMWFRNMEP